jgi:uncharacterized iron-regulated membrane protein
MKVFKEVKKGGAMKRVIMLAMVLVLMLASIGGCWPWWYEDGRGGRGEGHDRGGGHDRDQRHEQRR